MVENIQTYTENGITVNLITLDNDSYANLELKEERNNICINCEYNNNNSCLKCSCIIDVIMTYVNSKCPINKW